MAQEFWLADDPITADRCATLMDLEDCFDDIVNMALRVNAVRNRQTYQIHCCRYLFSAFRMLLCVQPAWSPQESFLEMSLIEQRRKRGHSMVEE